MTASNKTTDEFWPWSCQHYQRHQPELLALQEAHGVSVMLILLLSWPPFQNGIQLPALLKVLATIEPRLLKMRAFRKRHKPRLSKPRYQQLIAQEIQLEYRLQQQWLQIVTPGKETLRDYLATHTQLSASAIQHWVSRLTACD